jgi:polysaccharide pyruvyl transferase WcaK-like protein
VDPRNVVGRRSRDVEAALARVDAVVTTRMHGLVLALRHGVPAVAVDAVPGGAKVARQAAVLGWPAVVTVDDVTAEKLSAWLAWALGADAAALARHCADSAARRLDAVRDELLAALVGGRGPAVVGGRGPTVAQPGVATPAPRRRPPRMRDG